MRKVRLIICCCLALVMLFSSASCKKEENSEPVGGSANYAFTIDSGNLDIAIDLKGQECTAVKQGARKIGEAYYEVTDKKITLKKEFLQTLDLGEQELTLQTAAGKATVTLTLSDSESPVIGNSVDLNNWIIPIDTMFTFPNLDVTDGHRIEKTEYFVKKTSGTPDSDFQQIGQDWTPSTQEGYAIGDAFSVKYVVYDVAGNHAEKSFSNVRLGEELPANVIDYCNSPQGLSKWTTQWDGETNSLGSFEYVTDEITGADGAYKVVSGDSRTGTVANQYQINPTSMDASKYKYLTFEVYNADERELKLNGNLFDVYLREDIAIPSSLDSKTWTKVLVDLDWYTTVGLSGAAWGFGFTHVNESEVPHTYYIKNFILEERTDTETEQLRADFESNAETYLGGSDENGNPDYHGSQFTKAEGGTYSWSADQASSGAYSMKIVPDADAQTMEFNLLNSPNLGEGKFANYSAICFDLYENGNTISTLTSFGYDLRKIGSVSGKDGWTTYELDLKQTPSEGAETYQTLNLWLDAKIHGDAEDETINYWNLKLVFDGTNPLYVDNVRYIVDNGYVAPEPDFRFSWEAEGDASTDSGKYVALSGGTFSLDDSKSTDGKESLLMVSDGTNINLAVIKSAFGLNGEQFTATTYFTLDIFVEEGKTVLGSPLFGNYGWNTTDIPTGRWVTLKFTLDRIPSNELSYFNDSAFYLQMIGVTIESGAKVWFDNWQIFL